MTTTAQSCSSAVLNNTNKYITKAEDGIEDNRLLLSIADGMNNLCDKLGRLEYVLERKNIEQNTQKGKGVIK
jgi:hypothetical protein